MSNTVFLILYFMFNAAIALAVVLAIWLFHLTEVIKKKTLLKTAFLSLKKARFYPQKKPFLSMNRENFFCVFQSGVKIWNSTQKSVSGWLSKSLDSLFKKISLISLIFLWKMSFFLAIIFEEDL